MVPVYLNHRHLFWAGLSSFTCSLMDLQVQTEKLIFELLQRSHALSSCSSTRLSTALSVAKCGARVLQSSKARSARKKKPGFHPHHHENKWLYSFSCAHHKEHSECQEIVEPKFLSQEPPSKSLGGMSVMVGNTKLSIDFHLTYKLRHSKRSMNNNKTDQS